MSKSTLVLDKYWELIEEYGNFNLLDLTPGIVKSFQSNKKIKLFQNIGFVCVYCGDRGIYLLHAKKQTVVLTSRYDTLTVDHIIPVSRGGTNSKQNKQPMCKKCNCDKGNLIPYGPTMFCGLS